MTPVRAEREALCDSLLAAGPDAPTLCDGLDRSSTSPRTSVVREHRPDVAAACSSARCAPGCGA
jgi:hypothetical protein